MTLMPIRSTKPPTVIASQPNGAVPDNLLATVDDHTGYIWKLAALPARGMRALHAAIKADLGITLSSVGRGRTFQTQYDVFIQRYTAVSLATYNATAGTKRKYWPDAVTKHGLGSVYWVLKPGNAMAAVPGTSPHGLWCADDVCLPGNVSISTNRAAVEWLYAHELDYGFAHSTPSEEWHLQWYVGDVVPAAVLAFENPPKPQPPTAPIPPASPQGDDMFLIKQADDPAVYLVIPATRLPQGRARVHVTAAQWDTVNAAYGPLTNVPSADAFGPILGS